MTQIRKTVCGDVSLGAIIKAPMEEISRINLRIKAVAISTLVISSLLLAQFVSPLVAIVTTSVVLGVTVLAAAKSAYNRFQHEKMIKEKARKMSSFNNNYQKNQTPIENNCNNRPTPQIE